jgi:hypothetical protein
MGAWRGAGHSAEACNAVFAVGAVIPAMATSAMVKEAALNPITGRSGRLMIVSPNLFPERAAGSGQMPGWRRDRCP